MSELGLYEQAMTAAYEVAVLDALNAEVSKALKDARAVAEKVFALTGEAFPQVNVVLPDGQKVGRITVTESAPKAGDIEPGVLEAWCRDHYQDAFEEHVLQSAWNSADVIEAVKAKVPGVVKQRLRVTAVTSLIGEITASGGWLEDKDTKEKLKVTDVTEGGITGAFSFTDKKGPERHAAIIAAWRDGTIDLPSLLALPAPEGETA
jgi:hypothetical protein